MRPKMHILDRLERKLDYVLELLARIIYKENQIMAEIDDLEAQVKANTDLQASAILLIQGLAAKLAAAATDPARIKAISSQLTLNASALADAITANTPAAN